MSNSVRPQRLRLDIESLEPRCLLSISAGDSAPNLPALTAEIGHRSDANGDGFVLTSRISIVGTTSPGALVGLDSSTPGLVERSTRADSAGHFSFTVHLMPGRTRFEIKTRDAQQHVTQVEVTATRGDAVLAWNTTTLNAIRADGTPPPQASRVLAMVQLAVYNSVNAVVGHHSAYHDSSRARPGTSAPAAAAEAAYSVLASLYPKQINTFDSALRESLATVPSGRGMRLGLQLGAALGAKMLALRANDGSAVAKTYTPGDDPGDWVPTPPRYLPALAPQWPEVTPFVLASGAQFRPPPPPALTSPAYATALNQVEEIGSTVSPMRTADQTTLAAFWSDVTGSTFTPPGHWNQIAQEASTQKQMGLVANARMLGILDAALADAAISCWDTKFFYNFWRPVTAIHAADQDGNPATSADASWTPLWNTPNFSSYTSGHSTFSGAAQVVLEKFFGKQFSFYDSGDPTLNFAARHFTSFQQAADEAGFSRVVGGIHFEFDNLAGLTTGREVGRSVVSHEMS